MPILSAAVFDNTGNPYDVSKILTPDFIFDEEAYKRYSPIYLPITYALSYAVQFAGLTALLTHTICWYGKDIWEQTKESFRGQSITSKIEYQPIEPSTPSTPDDFDTPIASSNTSVDTQSTIPAMRSGDVHNRLMSRYDDAPIAWYIITFIAMLAVGIFVVE